MPMRSRVWNVYGCNPWGIQCQVDTIFCIRCTHICNPVRQATWSGSGRISVTILWVPVKRSDFTVITALIPLYVNSYPLQQHWGSLVSAEQASRTLSHQILMMKVAAMHPRGKPVPAIYFQFYFGHFSLISMLLPYTVYFSRIWGWYINSFNYVLPFILMWMLTA